MDRAWIVVNPISGAPGRRRSVERFAATLEREGLRAEIQETTAAGDGARIARDAAAAGVRVVVAAGGDGTVNDVARGLLSAGRAETSLAVLPLGTSNLVARDLGVPLRSPERAAGGLAVATPIGVDVGQVNDRPWLACIGIGIDAFIVQALTARRRGHIRYHSYAVPMVQALREYATPRVTVSVDGTDTASGELVLVLNARPYAAFLSPARDAGLTTGTLEVVVFSGRGLLRHLRWGWRALRGRLGVDPDVRTLRGTQVRVESDGQAPYQIDGDVGGYAPLDILVRPGALRVALPAAAATP